MCKRLSQDGKYDGGRRVLYAAQAAEFQDLQQVKAHLQQALNYLVGQSSAEYRLGH
jgi:hypothetical protein